MQFKCGVYPRLFKFRYAKLAEFGESCFTENLNSSVLPFFKFRYAKLAEFGEARFTELNFTWI